MSIKKIGNWAYEKRYYFFFSFIGLIYFFNLFLDVMDIDAAQYASIAREMLDNKSFLEIYHRGYDFLDKPPMLFWMSALSMFIFGVSTVAYKLPAVLVIILGIFSTYKFTLNWYDKNRARFAALIIASTQAFMLITNDIRTDGILTGFSMFAIWQLAAFLQNGKFKHIIWGSVGIAFAMMSKGPVALIIAGAAIGSNILLNRRWKDIFKWQWIVMFIFVAILLIPMSYGLYTQFDLHPEKTVYGLEGPSGLRFFYWTQSFGRITGEIYWDNGAPFSYFFHTILWDFQPWVFFLVLALVNRFKNLFLNKLKSPEGKEQFTLGGFVLVFLALSMSNFKLPHYIFPIFPFAAIFTADYIITLYEKQNKHFKLIGNIQFGLMHILFVMIAITLTIFFPDSNYIMPIIAILFLALFYISNSKIKDNLERVITITLVTNIAMNIIMATHFYPNILPYQVGNVVGKKIYEEKIPEDKFFSYNPGIVHTLDFYGQRIVKDIQGIDSINITDGTYILTDPTGKEELLSTNDNWTIVETYPFFSATMLTLEFLYSETRESELRYRYLMLKEGK